MSCRRPLTKSWSIAKPAGVFACTMPSRYGSHFRSSLMPPLSTGFSPGTAAKVVPLSSALKRIVSGR
jgi:hypothetical protein